MKVSLITATYNSANNIKSCISSVNHQSYKNIEHIFVDGGSSDKTLDCINENSTREKIIISEKDDGIYDALNKGLELATGNIIGLVHSDDILASNEVVSDIVTKFIKDNADGVYGDLIYVQKQNLKNVVRYWKGRKFNRSLIFKGWMPAHPTLFLKKEVYEKHGHFDTSFRIAADYHFILKILKDSSFKFEYIPKVISKMRVGGASNKSLKNIILKSKEDLRAIKLNEINSPYQVLIMKNASKIFQFLPTKGLK